MSREMTGAEMVIEALRRDHEFRHEGLRLALTWPTI